MTIATPPVNKRTLLGGQFWVVAAAGALTVEGLPLAAALTVAGAYLVLVPALGSHRAEASKLLLRPE
ncbi:hypothetical protein [Halorussus litoreus]|uniref:hypothetical protein n=1 Tax=Halorussus litoreus TaxID=1710536 RepID=UPI0013005B75|nr:hypothetical protein [Halorussus litoreus]